MVRVKSSYVVMLLQAKRPELDVRTVNVSKPKGAVGREPWVAYAKDSMSGNVLVAHGKTGAQALDRMLDRAINSSRH